jgi:hypothetical protein
LEVLGAHRVFPRVDGDDSDSIESQFDDWQRSFIKSLNDSLERWLCGDFGVVVDVVVLVLPFFLFFLLFLFFLVFLFLLILFLFLSI